MGQGKRAPARVMGVAETEAFLCALRESGNVRRATAAAGLAVSAPYRRRASDGAFAAAWEAAVKVAAERAAAILAAGAPGRDTVRLQSGGRLQLSAPRAREWTTKSERVFLDVLSATANARAAATAAGVSASGAWVRRRRVPAFAEAWDEAVADGHARLEMLMMERGTALLGGAALDEGAARAAQPQDEDARDAAARAAFDPQVAMWLLKRQDQRRAGTARRKRPWEREVPIEEVRASIMRKVEAMARANARGLRSAGGGASGSEAGGAADRDEAPD
jgi:hypothetical protein